MASPGAAAAPSPAAATHEAAFERARQITLAAVDADRRNDLPAALDLYRSALEQWIGVLKVDETSNPTRANAIRTNMDKYMRRAEYLKSTIDGRARAGSDSAAARAAMVPPTTPKEDGIFGKIKGLFSGLVSDDAEPAAGGKRGGGTASGGRGRGRGALGPGGGGAAAGGGYKPMGLGTAARARGVAPPPPPSVGHGRGRGAGATAAGAGGSAGAGAAVGAATPTVGAASDKYEEIIKNEVLDKSPSVVWADIAGCDFAKQVLQEAVIMPSLRPDLFTGLRAPPKGVLLFGPPGTGKTLLAKAVATESGATFFNISASALTSKWMGEGEKLVRALFSLARKSQPAVIFVDEIDSVLSARSEGEHEASRRLKTEFLVQLDGAASSGAEERLLIMGATNRPQELDDAVIRRLVKRIYIPLPDAKGRWTLIAHLLEGQKHALDESKLNRVVDETNGYSGSDLAALCREAALGPVRELGSAIMTARADQVRGIEVKDFVRAKSVIRPSVSKAQKDELERWNAEFGTTGGL